MEIISVLVILSIIASVIFIGIATVRLIQAEDQSGLGRNASPLSDTSSNDVIYSKTGRSSLATIHPIKAKG